MSNGHNYGNQGEQERRRYKSRRRYKPRRPTYKPQYRTGPPNRPVVGYSSSSSISCWQYLLSFLIVGGAIAAGVFALLYYTGDSTEEPAAPVVAATPSAAAASTPLPDPAATAIAGLLDPPPTAKARAATGTPTPTPGSDRRYVGGRLLDPLEVERWIFAFTNQARQEHGLPALRSDSAVDLIARKHSENMVATDVFSHDLNGNDPTDRARIAGYGCTLDAGEGWTWENGERFMFWSGLAENIAIEYRVTRWTCGGSADSSCRAKNYHENEQEVARGLVDGWMSSPGHRENILDRESHRLGVGVAVKIAKNYGQDDEEFWATQNFSDCR